MHSYWESLTASAPLVNREHIDIYESEGVVMIRGLFCDWIDVLRAGIERNIASPGPFASENLAQGEAGRFFDDYCNWSRIPEFEQFVRNSNAGRAAAELMQSEKVQIFHDHVLVKEPGTGKSTPWHQDYPYYCVEAEQTVSFWCPVDSVKEATLRCVARSHRWNKPVLPVRWLSDSDFYTDSNAYIPVPDPELAGMKILEWEMEPGDAVAFNFKTLHGARGNNSHKRRRAFSIRFVGDDARYQSRSGPTSPPFPGNGMIDGDALRADWFPTIYSRHG